MKDLIIQFVGQNWYGVLVAVIILPLVSVAVAKARKGLR